MFCSNCGQELPENANFCSNCGKPVREDAVPYRASAVQYEYCEIVWEGRRTGIEKILMGNFNEYRFWVNASGPEGTYSAGSTQWLYTNRGYPYSSNKSEIKFHNELKDSLLKDGWEQTGRGEDWYNDKFRREWKKK